MSMRDDERAMARMGRPLGDMPMDSGTQEPSRANALVRPNAARGYRPMPVDDAMRRKFAAELASDTGKLLRLREALEGTNLTTQDHPSQDAPYFSYNINFSSQRQAVLPGVDTAILVFAAVEPRYISVIRSLEVETFDAAADGDLAVSLLIGGRPQIGTIGVPTSAFSDFRRNLRFLVMQGQNFVVLLRNAGVVPHDALVRATGWKYTSPDVQENSRGAMQKNT